MTAAKRHEIRDLLQSVKLRLFFERQQRRRPRLAGPVRGQADRGYEAGRDEREFYQE